MLRILVATFSLSLCLPFLEDRIFEIYRCYGRNSVTCVVIREIHGEPVVPAVIYCAQSAMSAGRWLFPEVENDVRKRIAG